MHHKTGCVSQLGKYDSQIRLIGEDALKFLREVCPPFRDENGDTGQDTMNANGDTSGTDDKD